MTSHGLLYFVARVGGGLLTTVALAVFTRLLTPAEYGLYAMGLTVASIGSALLYQWLTVAVGRFYAAYVDRPGVLVAASRRGFRLASLAACLAFVAALAVPAVRAAGIPILIAVLLATIALGRYNLLLQVANVQGNPVGFGLLSWVKSAATLGAGAGLILLGGAHLGALFGVVAGLALPMLLFNPLRGIRPTPNEEARALSPRLLRYGTPLVLTFVGSVAVDYADRLLIGWLLGAGQVGPYAAAYDLSTQTIGAITNVLFLAAFPAVMAAFEREGEEGARVRMRSLGRAMVALALPAAVGFAVLSADVANLFLGASFRGSVTGFMPLLAAALWLGGFKSYYLDAVFQLRHVTVYQAYVSLLMMAANVALNLLLLPRMGVAGAAWATFAAFALGTGASYYLGRGHMRLHPLRGDLARAALACALMALPLLLLSDRLGLVWLLAKVLIGGSVYLAAAWALDVAAARAWLAQRWAAVAGRT